MSSQSDRFKKISVRNSITDTSLQTDNKIEDSNEPYSILQWLENSNTDHGKPDGHIEEYNDYLHVWSIVKNQTRSQNKKTVKETYINLLKEIVLNYTTAEEKRYFATIDYNNSLELDAVLPFFARRIKEVILYFVKKRNDVKYQKLKFSMRGSVEGTKRLIYNDVIQLVSKENISLTKGLTVPSVPSVVEDFHVNIDELYDLSQSYYDVGSVAVTTATTSTLSVSATSPTTSTSTGGMSYG